MAFDDMRQYLEAIEREGLLRRIGVPLDSARGNNDLQPLMRYLCSNEGPALLLENLPQCNTPGVPMIFNPFGTRERTAMTIGERDWRSAKIKHADLAAHPERWIKPVTIDRKKAPCKEVVIRGDDIDITKQLPHVWFGKEGPSYINGAVTVTHDIETGARNVGWYRLTQFMDASHPTGGSYPPERAKTDLACFFWWNPPMSQVGLHVAKAVGAGQRLKVAFAVMCDPAIHVAAGTGLPYGADEFEFAGALRGAPVELVKCETSDLEVPAHAEYIIEAEMVPGEQEPVGWHSNPMGYYDRVQTFPIARVTCITHRRKPLWYGTMEMVPPFDHNWLALLPVEGELLGDLRRKIPEVNDVAVTPNLAYVVQLNVDGAKKPHPEFGKYVLHAVWGAAGRWARTAKLVIVVGPDVDPYDWKQIEWAIMTRVQPYSDTIINRSGQAFVLDLSPAKTGQGGASVSEQMGIDATIKIPERHTEYPETSNATPAEVAALRAKLKGVLDL
jgi:4-hydroxy-3-polyprenylbenzoate decarboxylase